MGSGDRPGRLSVPNYLPRKRVPKADQPKSRAGADSQRQVKSASLVTTRPSPVVNRSPRSRNSSSRRSTTPVASAKNFQTTTSRFGSPATKGLKMNCHTDTGGNRGDEVQSIFATLLLCYKQRQLAQV